MIISLTGFMGCGKSSVGRKLSELLCCPFMDLDAEIEERSGCTVAEIFADLGEAEFRRLEKDTLKDVLETGGRVLEIPKTPALPTVGHPLAGGGMSSPSSSTPACKNQMILALGGGAVMTPECEEMVHGQTMCVYLRASVETLVERLTGEAVGRPLLNAAPSTNHNTSLQKDSDTSLRTRILDLMRQRASTYERVAHLVIDTDDKTIDQVASEIAERICLV